MKTLDHLDQRGGKGGGVGREGRGGGVAAEVMVYDEVCVKGSPTIRSLAELSSMGRSGISGLMMYPSSGDGSSTKRLASGGGKGMAAFNEGAETSVSRGAGAGGLSTMGTISLFVTSGVDFAAIGFSLFLRRFCVEVRGGSGGGLGLMTDGSTLLTLAGALSTFSTA